MIDLADLQLWLQRMTADVAALPPWLLGLLLLPVVAALASLRAVPILSTIVLALVACMLAIRKDPDVAPLAILVWLGACVGAAEAWRSRAASRRAKDLAGDVQSLELAVGRLEAARERNLVVGVRNRGPEPASPAASGLPG